MKILVVEDNEDSRILLTKQLCAYGHEVIAAADGVEALQQALKETPDILISDIMMPNMDGYQLCHECKQNDKLRDIPFIFYTATYTKEEDERLALNLGANIFIRKPTEPDAFVQILTEVFEKAKSGALAPAKIAPLEPSLFLTEYNKRIVAKLEEKMAELEVEIAQRKQVEQELRKQTHDVGERVKELTCLYSLSGLAKEDITSEELFQKTVEFLPLAWQYPEVTCARLTLNSQEFSTKNFRETTWKQTSDIFVRGNRIGNVEVYYLEERPEMDEGPFLKEERELITAIARHLGESIERKRAEEALKESEEKYRAIFDEARDGIVLVDSETGHIVDCNPEFEHQTGRKLEQLKKMMIWQVRPPEKIEAAKKKFFEIKGEGVGGSSELEFQRPDGEIVNIEFVSKKIRIGDKQYLQSMSRDITERKKMEEQLIVTDRLASIGELSSGIAHELNNPLTSVIGFSELLLDKDVPDDVKEDLRVINREAKRTARVVSNLLTFARKHPQEKQSVNINSIIEKVQELRTYEQKVNNIEVNTRFAPDLPEITANSFDLQQVFLNIIINAEHFMIEAHRRGALTITTERVGNIIRASFADDGPGIAKENLGYLFNPFFTTKEVGKGTGLGLSICHGIVTEHGGRIYAESKLGKGATFIVELPISK